MRCSVSDGSVGKVGPESNDGRIGVDLLDSRISDMPDSQQKRDFDLAWPP